MQAYSYTVNYRNDADIYQHLWSRRGDYFDKVIDEMLLAKLQTTFEPKYWANVFTTTSEDFDKERRILQHQLSVIEEKMASLLDKFSFVQSKTLIQTLECQFTAHEQEKARLEHKLSGLQQRIEQQESLAALAQKVEQVLAKWQGMGLLEKRGIAQRLIEKIVVTLTAKQRIADVAIHWHDNSTDEFVLPYRSDAWELWNPEEVERLKELIQQEADQITIASALPNRNWRAIRIKAYEILGERKFHISPKPIRDPETFRDYQLRLERDGRQANRTSGNRWKKDELKTLAQGIQNGATQLEIAAALPHRSWEAIRKKIAQVYGKGINVPEASFLAPSDTFQDYLEANPETARAMSFSILESCLQR